VVSNCWNSTVRLNPRPKPNHQPFKPWNHSFWLIFSSCHIVIGRSQLLKQHIEVYFVINFIKSIEIRPYMICDIHLIHFSDITVWDTLSWHKLDLLRLLSDIYKVIYGSCQKLLKDAMFHITMVMISRHLVLLHVKHSGWINFLETLVCVMNCFCLFLSPPLHRIVCYGHTRHSRCHIIILISGFLWSKFYSQTIENDFTKLLSGDLGRDKKKGLTFAFKCVYMYLFELN
jgi:hypothetical protein